MNPRLTRKIGSGESTSFRCPLLLLVLPSTLHIRACLKFPVPKMKLGSDSLIVYLIQKRSEACPINCVDPINEILCAHISMFLCTLGISIQDEERHISRRACTRQRDKEGCRANVCSLPWTKSLLGNFQEPTIYSSSGPMGSYRVLPSVRLNMRLSQLRSPVRNGRGCGLIVW